MARGASVPAMVWTASSVTTRPAESESFMEVAPVGSTPITRIDGRTPCSAAATPPIRPPPPTATITVSRSGTCSSSSSPTVP